MDPLQRLDKLLLDEFVESEGVKKWFYLSYADDDGFRGGLYVKAVGPVTAAATAKARGISPGGEVRMVGPLPEDDPQAPLPPVEYRERLLTLEEMQSFAPMVKWDGEKI